MAAEFMSKNLPLIAIVGPTASGKTSLAIRLAKKFGGEIICADSRTVYKGLDIGTAKPTIYEQSNVPHWGLDLLDPDERFTAADFKQYALEKISEIRSRGHVPFLVGGTGLYIDAVIFDFQFEGNVDMELRNNLEYQSIEELQKYCKENNIILPENKNNKRHLINNIQRKSISNKTKNDIINNLYVVGIATNKQTLRIKIEHRIEQIFSNNVVEEAILLGKKYGWSNQALTGNVYPLIHKYLVDELDQVELTKRCILSDVHLAKRQMTWFRGNPYIVWGTIDVTEHYLLSVLENL